MKSGEKSVNANKKDNLICSWITGMYIKETLTLYKNKAV